MNTTISSGEPWMWVVFILLKYVLAMVLAFIGAKMLIVPWCHVPVQASFAIVAVLIGSSVIASLIATRKVAT